MLYNNVLYGISFIEINKGEIMETKMKSKVITITDTQNRVDFWAKEIENFFKFKHELLEKYIELYPEVLEKFRSEKLVNHYTRARSHYAPGSYSMTDGDYYEDRMKKEILTQLQS